jgi:hypothetical protein
MSSLRDILLSMDQSLKSIAQSLERLTAQSQNVQPSLLEEETNLDEIIQGDEINPDHKESQLFMDITGVYMQEERDRIKAGKSKKAARRVSVNLGDVIVKFFTKELSSIPQLSIERSKIGGLIVFSMNGEPVAVLKFLTDLGYSRSERFYDVIQDVQNLAEEEFGVAKDNVFFLISSLFNGIEKSFVEQNIGENLVSTQEFLLNKKLVRSFLNNYISNAPFKNPNSNIYFMAAELHPNVLANDILEDLNRITGLNDYQEMIHGVNVYDWFSSIEDLIDEISNIGKFTLK